MKPSFHLTHDLAFAAFLAGGALGLLTSSSALAGDPPATIDVTGTVRDFRERTEDGGHPDFEQRPMHGFARYVDNIASDIGAEDRPVFVGGGYKIAENWRDVEHRPICRLLYDPELGDIEGTLAQQDNGGITSSESFALWYTDELGVNLAKPLTITLALQPDGRYVFDDRLDPVYAERGGFFPIDDDLFGNSPKSDHNFHFTYELHLECEYDSTGKQFFMFIGDDDVWVFVNGKLVIDLGGVHAALDQYIDMDRLGLKDGETYRIDFFFAERFRPQSNFRIETNIPVRTAGLPSTTAAFD
ncbi:MAG: fibro-slime domain-containing protein [Phycisphaerales bacterium]|nr:MAG: fibro-slime domain-containing protein [Phycisphaerales bacterium]